MPSKGNKKLKFYHAYKLSIFTEYDISEIHVRILFISLKLADMNTILNVVDTFENDKNCSKCILNKWFPTNESIDLSQTVHDVTKLI